MIILLSASMSQRVSKGSFSWNEFFSFLKDTYEGEFLFPDKPIHYVSIFDLVYRDKKVKGYKLEKRGDRFAMRLTF